MIESQKHLLRLLRLDKVQLENLLSNLDFYYYQMKKVKKDKKGNIKRDAEGDPLYRVLYPSKGNLKTIQSCIKDRILNQLELPILVQGGVRGRDNVSNALIHKGNKYFFLTDIEKFFPSIRHFQVYEMLVSNGFSPTVAGIITKLTTYKGRLPQGTPTSTALANLTFCVVDAELSAFCEEYNLTFTRFVDDITISSKKPFKQLSGPIVKIITRHGYSISKKKTAYKIGPTNVTGASVHNNFLTTTPEFTERLGENITVDSLAGKLAYRKRVHSVGKKRRKSALFPRNVKERKI